MADPDPKTAEAAAPATQPPPAPTSTAKKLEVGDDGLMHIEGFSDTRVGNDLSFYQPQDGRTDRIAVLPSMTLLTRANVEVFKPKLDAKIGRLIKRTVEEEGKPVEKKFFCGHAFKGANVHFTEKGAYRCLGKGKVCCTLAGKDPALVIPVPVLKYPTNQNGDLSVKPEMLEAMDREIMIWKLNDSLFGRLRSTEKEFPLFLHDVKIKGKQRGKYVNVENVTPCAEVLWQKFSEQAQDFLITVAASIYDQKIDRFLGRKLTELQIKELFGMAPVNPGAANPSSGTNVDDLVSGL